MWAEAPNRTVYILNHTGSSRADEKTPYEVFTGKTTLLDKFHMCYVLIPKAKGNKWNSNEKQGIFVGYPDGIDGFRVCIQSENQVIYSRDVVLKRYSTAFHGSN